jgi:N,N'-diacetyllegionaminate synthase
MPILIAECCQNHNGDRDLLKRMIHEAAEAGADCVKLQTMRSRELTLRERFEEGLVDPDGSVQVIKRPYEQELKRLSGLDLTQDDERWFVEECWRAGAAPMTTVFTRAGIGDVAGLGYEAVKIASYDCASLPLLRDARESWSTLFVSTGATLDDEIEAAARTLAGSHFHFLHCVTIYPTPMSELHLRRMNYLRRFTPHVGYSDHTKPAETDLWASKIALALGASCLERHFTVLGPAESRDGPVSVTPQMMRELRRFADLPRIERMAEVREGYPDWEATLGEASRPLSHAEMLNRDYYRGRFASRVGDTTVYNWEEVEAVGKTARSSR